MSVVGFDIGNGNCVIASVKDGGIDVLLNAESNRETPSVVSFGEKQRFLGSTAAASAMMNPKSTISQVKRLVGLNFSQANVKDELRLFPFETSIGPDGSVLIHLQYLGETQTFSPVQILAMLLSHLKEVTEKSLEKPISDCVIGIPSYFTDLQRRGYLDAAKIAGLKPLRLMHDCTATALGYGIYKKDFSSAGPINVVFIDVGHCDTQVTVASFWAGRMKILSHAFDSCLGGRDFDEVLFNYFATKFREQYHIDVYSNIRASIRLRAACEKLKKVLSANVEAPLNIECLMDEKDVNSFIQREEFEKLSSSLVERISLPCNKALSDADITIDKIYSVELVGSGSRVPVISKMVSSLFNREPSRRLNVSECVARGCALQCAMLSPTFGVRDYEVQDSSPFSIGLSSEEGPISTLPNGILFKKGEPIPSLKVLTLDRASMFTLYVHYVDQNELPSGASLAICRFVIGPFRVSNAQKMKVKVTVQLNIHGIVSMESASLDGTRNNMVSSRIMLPIHKTVFGGITNTQLVEAHDKELRLVQQDQLIERTKEKKNALEAYVYEMRNKLLREYRGYATDSEREDISIILKQTADWLYDDGAYESEIAYSAKMQDLKKLVDPIESQYRDEESRSQAAKNLLEEQVDANNTRRNSNSNAKKVSSETLIDSVEDGVCTQHETSSMPPQEEQLDGNNTRRNSNSNAKKVSSETVLDSVEESVCTKPESSSIPPVDGTRNNMVSSRIMLPIHETAFGGMTNTRPFEARDIELSQRDQLIERTKEKKKALAAYLCEIQNKFLHEYWSYATDLEREDISRNIRQTADWLNDDGDDESENFYSAKMQDLKKLVDPIESRYQATKDLVELIGNYQMDAKSHPHGGERQAVLNECFRVEVWLRNNAHQLYPLHWTSNIRNQAEYLDKRCKRLLQPRASRPQPEDNRGPNPSNRTANMRDNWR